MGRFSRRRKRRIPDPDEIVALQPFGDRLRIRSAERIPGRKELRRSALFVTAEDGRRFKLRACESTAQARKVEAMIRDLPLVLPAFHGRDGHYLLFERLDGYRTMDEASLAPNARGLGRLCATVNQQGAAAGLSGRVFRKLEPHRAVRKFRRELDLLRRHERIDPGVYERLGELFALGLRECDTPIRLELRDLHMGNLMLNEAGDLRFVDELGLAYCMQGLGIGKLLRRPGREALWPEFRAGYAEVADAGALTPEYLHFVRIVAGVHAAARKVHDDSRRAKLLKVSEGLREASMGRLGDFS
jgi:hypothetical protein